MCASCYVTARKAGRIAVRRIRQPGEDLWAYIASRTTQGPNGCLDWTGGTDGDGYPFIFDGTRNQVGSRLVLQQKLGRPIRRGYIAMHSCDRPMCINPEHLIEGTHAENQQDMYVKGRGRKLSGEQHPAAKLTNADIVAIRRLRADGIPTARIALQYGTNAANVRRIVSGARWKHVA